MNNLGFSISDFFTSFSDPVSIFFLLFLIGAFLFGLLTGVLSRVGKIRKLKTELKETQKTQLAMEIKQKEFSEQIGLKEADLKRARLSEDELRTQINVLEADKRDLQKRINKEIDKSIQLERAGKGYSNTIKDLSEQLKIKEQEVLLITEKYKAQQAKTVAPQPRPAAAATRSASTKEISDDLSLINGIGPFIEKKLNQIGITKYAQIAAWSTNDVQSVTEKIQFFPGRIKQDNWVGQAQQLLQEKNNPVAKQDRSNIPSNPEDLKIIEGIGPKTEELLKSKGIQNWKDLANTTSENLRELLDEVGPPFQILDPSTWSQQARLAANAEWKRFQEYQEYLSK